MPWILRADESRRHSHGVLIFGCAGQLLASVLLVFGCMQSALAQVTYTVFPAVPPQSQAQGVQPTNHGMLVTLDVEDSTMAYVVSTLVRQSHLRLFYNDRNPAFAKKVTVHMVKANVMDALASVLRGTGLEARLASDGETVAIGERVNTSLAGWNRVAGGIIVGHVTDSASGQGLRGAQVRVEGAAKITTITSDSGNFTLRDVPLGDQVLQIRLFGYKPTERTVTVVDSQRIMVRIVMVQVPTVLSGVVTTATGKQERYTVGNDITALNVDSIMKVNPISSVTDLLETRVPGLTVLHSSGVPGAPSRIRIRGAGSITGNNDPIVIVDGVRVYASQSDSSSQFLGTSQYGIQNVTKGNGNITSRPTSYYAAPSPLDQIDPNSIETIEVFKGPSASALYGSDAANGVIVITTKHGRAGPTHWSLTLDEGVNYLPGNWPSNYYRFGLDSLAQSGASGLCSLNDVLCSTDSIRTFQALNDPRYTVFSHGTDQMATLSVSGGVPTLQYSISGSGSGTGGNLKLPGIEAQRYESFYGPVPGWMLRPDNYQTWGGNGQLSATPRPTLHVTLQSSLFKSTGQQGSLQQAITQLAGEYIGADQEVFNPTYNLPFNLATTPLIVNDVEKVTTASLTATNSVTIGWQPIWWLPLTATGGINTVQRTDEAYTPFGINAGGPGGSNGQVNNTFDPRDTTGYYSVGRGNTQDNTLTVGTSIPVWHNRITLGLGGNLHSTSTGDFFASTNELGPGISTPTVFPNTTNSGVTSSFSQSMTGGSTYGWYVEPRLNLSSRFFAAPGFRLDGGSASGNQGGFQGSGLTAFPKIDFSYVAVDQSNPKKMLTLLRPRVAFGYAGTQPGPTEKLRLINSVDFTGGSNTNGIVNQANVIALNDTTILPAMFVSTLGNTMLQPEKSSELEGGVDAELWHGRVALTWTQYNKTRHNAIISVPVAPSVEPNFLAGSASSYFLNVGEVRNTGTEGTLQVRLFESRALSWMVGGNISNNNNLVVHLNNGLTSISLGGNQFIKPGYPLNAQFATPIVSAVDANHDGLIEGNEIRYGDSLVYVGQADPKYQINFNTGVTMLNGRLSVNATFAYQNGMTQQNFGSLQSGAAYFLLNTPNLPLTSQAAYVAATCSGGNNVNSSIFDASQCNGKGSTIGLIQTVNTFRFNALSVNYTVPSSIAQWFRVPRMTLALQGSNLALHTNYRGKDPNVNAFATVSGGDETADLGQIPEPRTWGLKLTLGN